MNPAWANDTFRERVRFLHESEFWPAEKLASYQLDELKKTLRYAYENIPYYENLFKARGLTPEDFKSLEDLAKLPLLTKAMIQSQYDDFIPKGINKASLMTRSTGGSTGTPLTVYMDEVHLARDKANTEYYMNIADLNIFDFNSVRLYGDRLPEEVLKKGEYWILQENRKLVMSCYHINKQTAAAYVNKLNEIQPYYIHSRPSAIYPLAKSMKDLGLKLNFTLKAIFLDGEVLTDGQRELLEKVLGARVFLIYGHTEGCVFGASCKQSRLIHFAPQVGVLELLGVDGNSVTDDGGKGEMVVTGFNNQMFPLIRYQTLDVGVYSAKKCACGRHYTMLERIEGRVQDYAVNKRCEPVPIAPAIFNYNDMDWKGIKEFRVRQEEAGKLVFVVVREPDTSETEDHMKKRLLAAFQSIFAGMFDIELEYARELPRTKIGKFRYLDQKLDMAQYGLTEAQA